MTLDRLIDYSQQTPVLGVDTPLS